MEHYILQLPIWLVCAAPLAVLLSLRIFLRPYARLFHPCARASRHRIECCHVLLWLLVLLALLCARVVVRTSSLTCGNDFRAGWSHWLLAFAFAYPVLASLGVAAMALARLHTLVKTSCTVSALSPEWRADIREAAELLELPERRLPRLSLPSEGPPAPFVYGLGVGPAVLIFPTVVDEVCSAVADGDPQLARALRLFFIGHELGHVTNGEVGFLCFWRQLEGWFRWWCPLLFATYLLSWLFFPLPCHWVLLPSLLLLGVMASVIHGLSISAGREREFAADTAGLYAIVDDLQRDALTRNSESDPACSNVEQALSMVSYLRRRSLTTERGGSRLAWSLGAVSPGGGTGDEESPLQPRLYRCRNFVQRNWEDTHPPLRARRDFWQGPHSWYDSTHGTSRLASLYFWHLLSISAVISAILQLRYLLIYLWLGVQSSLPFAPQDQPLVDHWLAGASIPILLLQITTGIVSNFEGALSFGVRAEEDAGCLGVGLGCLGLPLGLLVSGLVFGPLYSVTKVLQTYLDGYGWDVSTWSAFNLLCWYTVPSVVLAGFFLAVLCGNSAGSDFVSRPFGPLRSTRIGRALLLLLLLVAIPCCRLILMVSSRAAAGQPGPPLVLAAEVFLLIGFSGWLAMRPRPWRRFWRLVWPEWHL